MKNSPEPDPAAPFPDPKHQPVDTDLVQALGPAWPKVAGILHHLHAAHPEVTEAWQFSPRAGWYQVQLRKKRRLLYLVPRRAAFRLSLILGGKAIAALKTGPFARPLTKLLQGAKRYPEGTAFTFEDTQLDPELVTALLDAKITH